WYSEAVVSKNLYGIYPYKKYSSPDTYMEVNFCEDHSEIQKMSIQNPGDHFMLVNLLSSPIH
ncbi:MAG: hypothetical protein NUV75_00350, partial [Gallionella sp.]|nr:hypothetical protein [Gallionella sp.]